MPRALKSFPVAEAAEIDSSISAKTQRVFGGTGRPSDLEDLQKLVERRVELMLPAGATESAARLRQFRAKIRKAQAARRPAVELAE